MCSGIFQSDGLPVQQFSPEPGKPETFDRKKAGSLNTWETADEGKPEDPTDDFGLHADTGPPYEDLMSFEQIAQALGLTPRVVRAIYQRAMEKIKKRPLTLRKFQLLVEYRRALRERESLAKTVDF